MSKPLICFVAILKDEASNIRATLESVISHVDRWVVLDTGSTDGTQGIVREVLGVLPGCLHEEPFIDFATSRNRVLELAAGEAAFTLMLSGDEVLRDGVALREYLDAQREAADGAYCIDIQAGSQTWFYPRVLRGCAGWKYEGAVQEIPVGPGGERRGPLVPVARIVHTVSDQERRSRRVREFDLPTLTRMVEDDAKPLSARANSMFHLAETLTALAAECDRLDPGSSWMTYQMQAMSYYFRYAMIAEDSSNPAHDAEKAVFAFFRFYNVAENVGVYSDEEILRRLLPLIGAAPRMPELRYMAAVHTAKLDARRGCFLAEEAARYAREARDRPTYLPTDGRLEWLSLRLAAACAHALRGFARASDLAQRGVAAGGPTEFFEEFLKGEVT